MSNATLKQLAEFRSVNERDIFANILADRHYSRKSPGSGQIGGPGKKLILLTADCQAVIGFRESLFRKDGQTGVECFIFRNEGSALSSFLLEQALPYVLNKWNHTRLFTYVNPLLIRSCNPGCCFKKAGWTFCGKSLKSSLLIFECYI